MSKIKIKEAALELFAKNGYENTSIKDIAKVVGIKAPSIYAHFESKESIFTEILNELIEQFSWENIDSIKLSNNVPGTDLKSVLYDVFKGYYNYFSNNRNQLLLWQRVRFFSPKELNCKYNLNYLLYSKPIYEVYINLFRNALDLGQIKNMNIELAVMSFLTFCSGILDSLIIVPFYLNDIELKEIFNNYWNGINFINCI